MAAPLLLAPLDGTLAYQNGGAGGTAVGTGALRWVDGETWGQQAALIEEATTNYIPNPRFAGGFATWQIVNGNVTLEPGEWARCTCTSAGWLLWQTTPFIYSAPDYYSVMSVSPGEQVSVSFEARGTAGRTLSLWVAWRNGSGTSIGDTFIDTTMTGAIQTIERQLIAPAGAARASFAVIDMGATPGVAFDIRRPQMERPDVATTYAVGDLGTGYAWVGAANGSASTRAAASIEIPCPTVPDTIAARYSEDGVTWAFASGTSFPLALGTSGEIDHDGSDLVLTTTRALRIGPVFAFADALLPEEIHALAVTPVWTWDQFAGPPAYVPPAAPTIVIMSPQDALDARRTNTWSMVLVDGISVPTITWDAQFGTDQASSTARFTLPLPKPANIQPNATVEILGGHDGFVDTLFHGRIPAWQASMRQRGNLLTVRAVGWSSLLTYRERFDLVYDGPISIEAIFDSLCQRRGVPSYAADTVTDPGGSIAILLGGNPQIDAGKVRIPANQPPLSWLSIAAKTFGYRVFDITAGTLRLARVSGLPAGDPSARFAEGVHLFGADAGYDIGDIVNYPDLVGPTYEDELGGSVPIRAFPSPIPSNPLIPVNEGINYREIRNSLLVTQQLAEIALQVEQIDGNAPKTPVSWDAVGTPGIDPGDVVEVDSPTVSATQRYWLVGLDLTAPDGGGLVASYDGWAGAGVAMPAGNNRQLVALQDAPVHLGNETLSHYAHPAPNGNISATRQKWTITIPERTTAVNVRFWHHGTNSQLVGGVQTDLEVSQFKVYAPGADPDDDETRPEVSGKLAILTEDLAQRYPYSRFTVMGGEVTDAGYWKPGAVNLSRLDAGTWDLYLEAGEKNGPDDFEVRYAFLELWGNSEPVVIPQEVA